MSWQNYAKIMNHFDAVIDTLNKTQRGKVSLAQLHDIKYYYDNVLKTAINRLLNESSEDDKKMYLKREGKELKV